MTEAPVLEPVLDWTATELARLRNEARAVLLRSGKAVTLELLATGRGAQVHATRQWVARHRRAGDLVTVSQNGQVLVPTFQLDEAFGLRPEAAALVLRLTEAGMDPWAIWDWMAQPNGWLHRQRPQEVLVTDAAAVDRAIDGLLQE